MVIILDSPFVKAIAVPKNNQNDIMSSTHYFTVNYYILIIKNKLNTS